MLKAFKKMNFFKKIFILNSLIFFIFYFFYLIFPKFDIFFSGFFFSEGRFLADRYIFIKELRTLLKNIMIIIPIVALFYLIILKINKYQKILVKREQQTSQRTIYALIGLVIGPIIGCGMIANLYFKDTWGRARPINIEEFKGNKIYTPPFIKSDQCNKNCSWIGGEVAGAYSLLVGLFLLRNYFYTKLCFILGLLVIFCRVSMGGHFLSDNLFSVILMIYLALSYRFIVIKYLMRKDLFKS
tara:strand:+ start:1691 stop:2416 length:726 start_codon:yes stop_codon:yes gene_type:complete